jgi:trans-aconitate methyltransferase
VGQEAEADVYDEGFLNNPRYRKKPKDAPWFPIWRAVARLVPRRGSVLDIGCGPGHLSCLVARRPKYIGIDFSKIAIAMAKTRNPWAEFIVDDLRTCKLPLTDIVLATEVLEHIEDDLGVLERIKPGRRIIISVPTYDSRTHVRWFDTKADVLQRYSGLIKVSRAFMVGERHFVVSGIRRKPQVESKA